MTLDELKRLIVEASEGPWEVVDETEVYNRNWAIAAAESNARIGLFGTPCCGAGNARLIAAAPDLAAQVVKLTEALERIDALEASSMPLDQFLEAKAIARAALEAHK